MHGKPPAVILTIKAGVGIREPVNRLEPVAPLLKGLEQRTHIICLATDPAMSLVVAARSVLA